MRRPYLLLLILFGTFLSNAQNVGIGTTTPGFPLNFSNTIGDKISLYGNSGNHYGFGIQGGLLQIHSDASAANISFGYGSSAVFTERMRIINSGADGLILGGRVTLRNGTSPLDLNYGAGIWMYRADNAAPLGFMGVQNNQNLGFYGGPAGWGFTYDAINSRVGIGNTNPNAPLSFPPSLGKKITLYPGATGDVGIGVSGNRLYLYADNPNADVAFGWDAAGVFNERFAIKPNGALALTGNTGGSGQVMMSNGSGGGVQWVPITQVLPVYFREGNTNVITTNFTTAPFPATTNIDLNITQNSRVILSFNIGIYNDCSVGPCYPSWDFEILLNGTIVKTAGINSVSTSVRYTSNRGLGPFAIDLTPGNHTISFRGFVAAVGSIGGLTDMHMTATAFVIPN